MILMLPLPVGCQQILLVALNQARFILSYQLLFSSTRSLHTVLVFVEKYHTSIHFVLRAMDDVKTAVRGAMEGGSQGLEVLLPSHLRALHHSFFLLSHCFPFALHRPFDSVQVLLSLLLLMLPPCMHCLFLLQHVLLCSLQLLLLPGPHCILILLLLLLVSFESGALCLETHFSYPHIMGVNLCHAIGKRQLTECNGVYLRAGRVLEWIRVCEVMFF